MIRGSWKWDLPVICILVCLFVSPYEAETTKATITIGLAGPLLTSTGQFDQPPQLSLVGGHPQNPDAVLEIHYTIDGQAGTCGGNHCLIPVSEDWVDGKTISFWADSFDGGTTPHYEALIRSQYSETLGWQVQVLSTQWQGEPLPAMALEWEAFPPFQGPSVWLATPDGLADLATTQPYQYLAGKLILAGAAHADGCSDGGLLPSGYASQCGLEASRREVDAWQNQFDRQVFAAAIDLNLSPVLLKGLIAQESQFWPGEYAASLNEFGLSRVTNEGADTALMWNSEIFGQRCAEMFIDEVCDIGYSHLPEWAQADLQGALLSQMDATCPECDYGVDLEKAGRSIDLIAQALLANAAQAGQIITNLTEKNPGQISDYEDLWRFALVNYNAGPGCLYHAVSETIAAKQELSWPNVSMQLVGDCANAVQYVENVTRATASTGDG